VTTTRDEELKCAKQTPVSQFDFSQSTPIICQDRLRTQTIWKTQQNKTHAAVVGSIKRRLYRRAQLLNTGLSAFFQTLPVMMVALVIGKGKRHFCAILY
jgi:hypothetical protein